MPWAVCSSLLILVAPEAGEPVGWWMVVVVVVVCAGREPTTEAKSTTAF